MLRQLAVTAALLAAAGAAVVLPAAGSVDEADYARAERFGSPRMARHVQGGRLDVTWLSPTTCWYRQAATGCVSFVYVDAAAGVRRPAFDHERMAGALSAATQRPVSSVSLALENLRFEEDVALTFEMSGVAWRCDLDTYVCRRVDREPARNGTAPLRRGRDRRVRAEGQWRAVVRDGDLYLERRGSEPVRLTRDGGPGRQYAADTWSPDRSLLLAACTLPGDRRRMHALESCPDGDLRPRVHSFGYDLPGDRVDQRTLHLFHVPDGRGVAVQDIVIDWWGPHHVHWEADGRHVLFTMTHRGYQRRRLVRVNTETGAARTVIDETSDTFLPPQKAFVQYLDTTSEVIWSSERDGWNHLYLHDLATGTRKKQLTAGEWVVRGIDHVDEAARVLYFSAGGREPDRDPYFVHHYHVSLDGGEPTLLTPGRGDHDVTYSPQRRYLVDTYSRTDMAPVTELRDARDGSRVCELGRADVTALLATGWRRPEPFHAAGRDGETDIWGVIFRPSRWEASGRYPVVESIYAGPHGSFTPKRFRTHSFEQALAELGFIVVQIDGMGTSNRSKRFHDVAYRNLADGGFPDRIAWLRAAAKQDPTLDLSRVGIYGSSAGGYNAARALIAHHDVYKVAVSMAGNHDHRTDKVWWNELWMGYPVGEHYREQSNIENAARLRGHLFLIHGELDRNVPAASSTLRFVDALARANKDVDLLIYPGRGHGVVTPYCTRRLWDYFVRHLHGADPPHEYAMGQLMQGTECSITVCNRTSSAVTIYWLDFEGGRKPYHTLSPGQSRRQHTFMGHEWEAHADGRPIARFTAMPGALTWDIR